MRIPLVRDVVPCLVLVVAAGLCGQAGADEVKDALDTAKAGYPKSVGSAEAELVGAFDLQIKNFSQAADLDTVEQLIGERKAFLASKAIPKSSSMRAAVTQYNADLIQAEAKLKIAFQSALADYTKAGKIDDADAVKRSFAERFPISKPSTEAATKPATTLLSNDYLARMLPAGMAETLPDGSVRTSGMLRTTETFSIPAVIRVVAKTDSTNIRLYFAKGRYILNWEVRPTELRYNPIGFDTDYAVPGKGAIPKNTLVTIEWEVTESTSVLKVDGVVRHVAAGDFKGMGGDFAIGAGPGALITVQSVVIVESKKDQAPTSRGASTAPSPQPTTSKSTANAATPRPSTLAEVVSLIPASAFAKPSYGPHSPNDHPEAGWVSVQQQAANDALKAAVGKRVALNVTPHGTQSGRANSWTITTESVNVAGATVQIWLYADTATAAALVPKQPTSVVGVVDRYSVTVQPGKVTLDLYVTIPSAAATPP